MKTYSVDELNQISLYGTCPVDGSPLDVRLEPDGPGAWKMERYCPACLKVR